MKLRRLVSMVLETTLLVACGGRGMMTPMDGEVAMDVAATDASVPTQETSTTNSDTSTRPADAACMFPMVPRPSGMGTLYQPSQVYESQVSPENLVRDDTRQREFPVLVRFPRGATGPLPVIIFSHGGGANDTGHRSYDAWGEALARSGYVVIHPAHTMNANQMYHCSVLMIPSSECEPMDFAREVSEGGTLPVIWYDKPRDATAILNALPMLQMRSGLMFDLQRVGYAGHSGGAHAVMSAAGAVVDVSPSVHRLVSAETRIRAFLALSPQGIGRIGMTERSWDSIRVPVMIQSGANDVGPGEEPCGRLDPFGHMPGPDKYQVWLNSQRATHGVFGLNPTEDQMLEQYVRSAGIAFFDAYLRERAEARTWLASDQFTNATNGVGVILRR